MDSRQAKLHVLNRRAMIKLQKMCDERGYPYPPELIAWLTDRMKYASVN